MKAKSLLMTLVMVLVASAASAADFREAATICSTMSFDSNRDECIANARAAEGKYFDSGAIQVCKSMSFDGEKNNCLVNITGKIYESFEISNCLSESFDSRKNSCLLSSGTQYHPPGRPLPPPSRPPQHGGHQSDDYVRGGVYSWELAGEFTAPKGFPQRISINLDTRRAVSEVRFAVNEGEVRVTRVTGVTASGALVNLSQLEGDFSGRTSYPRRVHPQYAIRLQRIELEVVSKNLRGSRAKVEVLVGYTR